MDPAPAFDWHAHLQASSLLLVQTAVWVAVARIVLRAVRMVGR